jgi:hypothetical protein
MRRISPDEGNGTDFQEKTRFIATAQYSPPEYLTREEAKGEVGFRALNVYQVGAVLHEAGGACSRRPYPIDEFGGVVAQSRGLLVKLGGGGEHLVRPLPRAARQFADFGDAGRGARGEAGGAVDAVRELSRRDVLLMHRGRDQPHPVDWGPRLRGTPLR